MERAASSRGRRASGSGRHPGNPVRRSAVCKAVTRRADVNAQMRSAPRL